MKKNQSLIAKLMVVMAAVLLVVLAGCSQPASKSNDAAKTTTVAKTKIKDPMGNKITLKKTPKKIVSLAPSVTQIIDSLGDKDKLVGVDTQSPNYVKGLKKLPKSDMETLDLEKLLSMDPDVIFVTDFSLYKSGDVVKKLKKAGITVAAIPTEQSIAQIQHDIKFVGTVLNKENKSKKIVSQMKSDINEIKDISSKIKNKKTVLFEIASLPNIYTVGNHSFINEMIEIAGAKNVFVDKKGSIKASEESVLKKNPDVILTNVNYEDDPVQNILNRKGWENVTAVKDKQVHYINNAYSSLPNQHVVQGIKEIAKAVYPDEFKALD